MFGPFLPIYHWMTSDVIGATKAGDIETLTKILEQRKGDDDLIKSRESDKVDDLIKSRESDKVGIKIL